MKNSGSSVLSSPGSNVPKGRATVLKIGGKNYVLCDEDVFQAANSLEYFETIRKHFLELANEDGDALEQTIKQLIERAFETRYPGVSTGDYFTSNRVRDIVLKLGFDRKISDW